MSTVDSIMVLARPVPFDIDCIKSMSVTSPFRVPPKRQSQILDALKRRSLPHNHSAKFMFDSSEDDSLRLREKLWSYQKENRGKPHGRVTSLPSVPYRIDKPKQINRAGASSLECPRLPTVNIRRGYHRYSAAATPIHQHDDGLSKSNKPFATSFSDSQNILPKLLKGGLVEFPVSDVPTINFTQKYKPKKLIPRDTPSSHSDDGSEKISIDTNSQISKLTIEKRDVVKKPKVRMVKPKIARNYKNVTPKDDLTSHTEQHETHENKYHRDKSHLAVPLVSEASNVSLDIPLNHFGSSTQDRLTTPATMSTLLSLNKRNRKADSNYKYFRQLPRSFSKKTNIEGSVDINYDAVLFKDIVQKKKVIDYGAYSDFARTHRVSHDNQMESRKPQREQFDELDRRKDPEKLCSLSNRESQYSTRRNRETMVRESERSSKLKNCWQR